MERSLHSNQGGWFRRTEKFITISALHVEPHFAGPLWPIDKIYDIVNVFENQESQAHIIEVIIFIMMVEVW